MNQAYTRCNLFVPDERLWVTSDAGIYKTLIVKGFDALYIDPEPVMLSGFSHGFFGGCCGLFEDKILVNGSIKNLREEKILREKAEQLRFEIIELHPGPLQDVGGLLFIKPEN